MVICFSILCCSPFPFVRDSDIGEVQQHMLSNRVRKINVGWHHGMVGLFRVGLVVVYEVGMVGKIIEVIKVLLGNKRAGIDMKDGNLWTDQGLIL